MFLDNLSIFGNIHLPEDSSIFSNCVSKWVRKRENQHIREDTISRLLKVSFIVWKTLMVGIIQSYIKRIQRRISIGLLDLQILMEDIYSYCFTK